MPNGSHERTPNAPRNRKTVSSDKRSAAMQAITKRGGNETNCDHRLLPSRCLTARQAGARTGIRPLDSAHRLWGRRQSEAASSASRTDSACALSTPRR